MVPWYTLWWRRWWWLARRWSPFLARDPRAFCIIMSTCIRRSRLCDPVSSRRNATKTQTQTISSLAPGSVSRACRLERRYDGVGHVRTRGATSAAFREGLDRLKVYSCVRTLFVVVLRFFLMPFQSACQSSHFGQAMGVQPSPRNCSRSFCGTLARAPCRPRERGCGVTDSWEYSISRVVATSQIVCGLVERGSATIRSHRHTGKHVAN